MINLQEIFGYLTGVLLIIGFALYLVDIVRGKTKPERASWLIWSVLGGIAFFSQLADGATWSLVLPGIDTLIVFAIFVLSIRYGVGGLLRRDIISLVVAALGLLLWYLSREPLVALLAVLGVVLSVRILLSLKPMNYQPAKRYLRGVWLCWPESLAGSR